MLKKLKLSLIPFACATTFFSIFSQVSCSINDSANSHYQYILDRTFSIVMYAEKYAVDKNAKIYQKSEYNSIPISAGTCWILDHVNQPGAGLYEYWIGTNLHVYDLFDINNASVVLHENNKDIYVSNNVFYDNDIDDYCRYAYSNITMRLWAANSIDEEIEWGGVYRSASHLVSYSQDNSYSGNFLKNNKQLYAQYYVGDFSIIDVDFGDFDHSEMDELILSHLNNLNSKYVEKNIPITKFKKTPELNKNKPTNNTFYTLGYPASLLGNSALTEDKTKGKPTSLYFFPDYTGPADISFWMDENIKIVAGVYYKMDKNFQAWHGQSGSMVVDKDNNLVGLVDLGIGERGETTNYLLIICNEQEINTNGLNYKYNYISDFLDSVGISGNAQDKYFA